MAKLSNCPNPNDPGYKDFKELVNIAGETAAYNIWNTNIENGEDGPLLKDNKSKSIVLKLVEEGYAETTLEAARLYTLAYEDKFRKQIGIENPRDITFKHLIGDIAQGFRVSQVLNSADIKDVVSSFYFAALYNIEDYTVLDNIDFNNIDLMLNGVEEDNNMYLMNAFIREGTHTREEVLAHVENEGFLEEFLEAEELLSEYSDEDVREFYEIKNNRLEIARQNKDYFTQLVKAQLKEDNINIFRPTSLEDTLEDSDADDIESTMESSGVLAKASHEVNPSESATAAVKSFFRTIPEIASYENGVPVYNTDTFLGTPKMFLDAFNFVLKHSSGVVQIKNSEGRLSDPIEEIASILDTYGGNIPTYSYIADKLRNSSPTFKTQFITSVNKYKANNKDTLITTESNNKGLKTFSASIVNSDYLGDKLTVTRNWQDSFNTKFSTLNAEDDIVYDTDRVNSIISRTRGTKGLIADIERHLELDNIDSAIELYTKLLNNLSIDVSKEIVKRHISLKNGDSFAKKAGVFNTQLNGFLKDLETIVNAGELNEEYFSQETLGKELADIYIDLNGIPESLSVRGPKGTRRYSFENYNFLTLQLARLSKGDTSYFNMLDSGIMQSYSVLLPMILNNENDIQTKLKAAGFGNLKNQNSKDPGDKYGDLKDSDKFIDAMLKYDSGIWVGLAEADKSSQFYLEGGLPTYQSFSEASINISKEKPVSLTVIPGNPEYNVIKNYLKSEVARIVYEHKRLTQTDENGNPLLKEEDMIQYYHYLKTPGDMQGSALRFSYFNGLTVDVMNEILGDGANIFSEEFDIADLNVEDNENLNNFISSVFENLVNQDVKIAIESGVLSHEGNLITNNSIPINILDKHDNNPISAIKNFTLNSLVANIEMTMLFTMDVSQYKAKPVRVETSNNSLESLLESWGDYNKRIPAISAPGIPLYISNNEVSPINETYTSATIKDIVEPSNFINKDLYKIIAKKENLSENQVSKELGPYSKVDKADAQAWITLDLWRQRITGRYGWNQIFEDVYQRMLNGTYTYADLKTLTTVPLKTTHVEVILDPAHPRTPLMQYNKQSEFPIIPGLTSELDSILEVMNNSGVEHLIVESGKKVGGIGVKSIRNKEGKINLDTALRPVVLDTRHALIQQEVKSKGKKNILVPSQPTKNIIALVNSLHEYANGRYGQDVLAEVNETISRLSDEGLNNFLKDLGVEPGETINDLHLNKFFLNLLKGEISQGAANALREGMPLESILEVKDKVDSKLLAYLKKSAISLKQFGGVAVQASSFGFGIEGTLTKDVKSNIKWLKDKHELAPMMLKEGKEGVYRTEKAQVLLSHDVLDKIFRELGLDLNSMSSADIKAVLSPELLEGIMYRIPNQGPSSNDSFEIVGILPPGMGDVIVGFDEITTKTGSDFDIDKVFMLLSKPDTSKLMSYSTVFNKVAKDFDLPYNRVKDFNDALSSGDYDGANAIAESLNLTLDILSDMLTTGKIEYLKENPIKPFDTNKSLEEMSTEELQQKRLELYGEILSHPDNYYEVMKPLDTPWLDNLYEQDLLQNKKSINVGGNELLSSPLLELTGARQFKNKSIFDSAKNLVGVVANHMTHFGLLKSENINFHKYYLGVGIDNGNSETVLSNVNHLNGEDISETFVGFMNAIVDAAKDPKIVFMNVNQVTAPTIFMLARAGMNRRDLMLFASQPILKDYVSFINKTEGRTANKSKTPEELILEKYGDGDIVSMDAVDGFRNNYLDSIEDSINENVLKEELDNPSNKYQLSILKQFLEWQNKAKQLNSLINITKVDVEGAGKNFNASRVKQEELVDMLGEYSAFNQDGIENLLGLKLDVFGNVINNNKEYSSNKMMGTYLKNGPIFINDNMKPITLDSSPTVFYTVKSLIYNLGKDLSNEEVLDTLARETASSLRADSEMLSGLASLDLQEVYNFLKSSENKELVESNLILRDLIRPFSLKEKGASIPYIDSLNKNLDTTNMTLLHQSWEELLDKDVEFTKVLIRSLFHVSGFTYSRNNFYKYISPRVLKEFGYSNFVDNAMKDSAKEFPLEDHMEIVIQNLSSNTKIVPELRKPSFISQKTAGRAGGFISMSYSTLKEDNYLADGAIPKYVQNNGRLYKYLGMKYTEQGGEFVIFSEMNTLGINGRLGSIKEYRNKLDAKKLTDRAASKLMEELNYSSDQVGMILDHIGEFSSYGALNNVIDLNKPFTQSDKLFFSTLLSYKRNLYNNEFGNTSDNLNVKKRSVTFDQIESRNKFCSF